MLSSVRERDIDKLKFLVYNTFGIRKKFRIIMKYSKLKSDENGVFKLYEFDLAGEMLPTHLVGYKVFEIQPKKEFELKTFVGGDQAWVPIRSEKYDRNIVTPNPSLEEGKAMLQYILSHMNEFTSGDIFP